MLNVLVKSHRTSLKANATEVQKLFVMLKLIPKTEVAKARPPLVLALVMDTSSSMQLFADQQKAENEISRRGLQRQQQTTSDGKYEVVDLSLPSKLEQAIASAHALIDDSRLLPEDKVTVIHFDDDAKAILPLTRLSSKQAAHTAIDSLRQYSGATHMGKGLDCAKQQLCDLPGQVAKRVLLLTDGQTFDESECRAVAPQFTEANTPIIAIGLGDEYNEELLLELAQVTQGRPYHLQKIEELGQILNEEVGTSVREVVTNLQATVSTVKGVTLDTITRVYPSLSDVNLTDSQHRLGNIIAGDYTVFILEFTVSGVGRPPSRVRIAQLGLVGDAPGLGRREEFPPQDLFVEFTTDERAIAEVDPEVQGYLQQKNVDRMVQDAVRSAKEDPNRARQTLQVAVNMTKRLGNSAVTKMLENTLDELNKTGTISPNTAKTIRAGGRTKTIKTQGAKQMESVPSQDEIRRLTGA
ncbi:von Willebrand factor type A [Planktothrix tepida]|uniref:von Willebrand factor type A n=1 Tax=Planktothrix tepida PCC 9214 TaxID=671072 RepID=A0A1J1LUY4_9CYAN|nr:VWA domain-containing protein [Planktothrix tepida]CAD5990449.1 von Willebrand factor type A [Planktothrix tepida]CUR35393.1 von Willebrand factor type A [Planktothrix tepida PCC 9214]